MVNICLNRLHVIGPVTPLQLFTQQVAAHSPKYAPAHSLALHLIEKIERGADPLEADRELANWLDTIGAGLPRRIPRFNTTRVLPPWVVSPDLSAEQRQARLADWMVEVKVDASLPDDQDNLREEDNRFTLHALQPIPDVVLSAGYPEAGWHWQATHWGTRSDAVLLEPPTVAARPDGWWGAVYIFETAWAPPLEALCAGSRRYPDLAFVVSYAEPEMDFYGGAAFQNGQSCAPEDETVEEVVARAPHFGDPEAVHDWVDAYLRQKAEGIELLAEALAPAHDQPAS